MKFEIDLAHLSSITINEMRYSYQDATNPTPEELMETLRGTNKIVTTSTLDHPAFTELREKLEKSGHILVQRHWWNGDQVLKPFKLNGYQFSRGQQFPCAPAMLTQLKLRHLKMKYARSLVAIKTTVTAKSRKLKIHV